MFFHKKRGKEAIESDQSILKEITFVGLVILIYQI